MDHAADIIIVGAGLAGLSAALELLDQGVTITLLDRDTPEAVGGLARSSFGGLLMVDTPAQRRHRLADSPERAYADWRRFGELGDGPEDALPSAWAQAYCEDSRVHLHDWLHGMGQRFMPLPLWVERNGNSVPRWHVCWGTGAGLVTTIRRALDRHPNRARLRLQSGARVTGLLREAGRIVGVMGCDEATEAAFEIRAPRVVIAVGGVNGDGALVREHWPPRFGAPPPVILNGAHRFADGAMHRAVSGVGGQVHRLDRNWHYAGGIHHWAPRRPDHGLSTVPARSALWVNGQGARIMPPMVSGFDTSALVAGLCAQPGGYGWQIMNRRIAMKELAVSGAEMNPAIRDGHKLKLLWQLVRGNRWLYETLRDKCVDMVVADDLQGLAARMAPLSGAGVTLDPARLAAVIEAHDAEIAKGAASSDPQMQQLETLRGWKGDALRLTRGVQIADPKAGPLVALRTFAIARKSLGGIVTDLNCRVLGPDGAAVPGLYAVGEAAGFGGGNMNGLRGLEGTFLGGALYSGRRLGWAVRGGA